MKHKFSSMWRVGLTLVMVLSLNLVMAAPVSAAVTKADVTVDPTTAGSDAKYTVEFTTTQFLLGGSGDIIIEFPDDTDITSYDGTVTVNGETASTVTPSGQTVTITVPLDVSAGPVIVILDKNTVNDIINPATADDYTLKVSTTAETIKIVSNPYTIIPAAPTIVDFNGAIGPPAANQGETLDVYIKGTNFVEGATSVSFSGTKITVDEVSVVDESDASNDYLIASITIASDAATGARDVTVTTTAGTSSNDVIFTVKEALTVLVDEFDSTAGDADLEAAGWLLYVASDETGINDAIIAMAGGDTLIAHAATYGPTETFPIVVDVTGLTIKSYMGAASTTIDGGLATGNVATLEIQAADVTIGGEDSGFTIITDKTAGIWVLKASTAGATGLRILYNTFQAKDQGESHGIWIEAKLSDGGQTALIDHNDFSQPSAFSQGGGQGAVGTAILIAEADSGIISNNTAFNQKYTFLAFKPEKRAGGSSHQEVDLGTASTIDGVKIFGNVVHDNRYAAVHFSYRGGADFDIGFTTAVKIYENQFYNNGVGIKIDTHANLDITDTDPVYGIVINYNDIYDNTNTVWDSSAVNQYGIWNKHGQDLDARYNWWGSIGGPSAGTDAKASTTALGNGDAVSTNVVYDPWLTETQAKTVTDGIAYFGSTMPLQKGWNTLSVPLKLKDSANTMADIDALGDFLTATNWEIAYQYNPVETRWDNIGTLSIDLVPLRGYYIKILVEEVSFPVLYSGTLGLPTLDLDAGWNLIGSGFGIDKTVDESNTGDTDVGDYGVASADVDGDGDPVVAAVDEDAESYKTVVIALASLGNDASVVISPSMQGQLEPWATTISGTAREMIVGEAYWVFMTDSATLAGFEVTPIYHLP